MSTNPSGPSLDPLDLLRIGNNKFVDDPVFIRERESIVHSPYAIVLSCSDARVPPEIVFGEWLKLGRLFVVRVAGNSVDPAGLGSIEYAATKLNPPATLLVVLGHELCGAVDAARAQASRPPQHVSPNLAWFVSPIKVAVERTAGRPAIETVRENVKVQIENVRNQSSIIRELERNGDFRIVGGVYNLTGPRSGVVDFFDHPPS